LAIGKFQRTFLGSALELVGCAASVPTAFLYALAAIRLVVQGGEFFGSRSRPCGPFGAQCLMF
jgi:hypothetical protein